MRYAGPAAQAPGDDLMVARGQLNLGDCTIVHARMGQIVARVRAKVVHDPGKDTAVSYDDNALVRAPVCDFQEAAPRPLDQFAKVFPAWKTHLDISPCPLSHHLIVQPPCSLSGWHQFQVADMDLAELLDRRDRQSVRACDDLRRLTCALERRGIHGIDGERLEKFGGLLCLQHAFRGERIVDEFIGKFFGDVSEILSVSNQIEDIGIGTTHTSLSKKWLYSFTVQSAAPAVGHSHKKMSLFMAHLYRMT